MKDEELWSRILLVVEIGDIVRFKYGRTEWRVDALCTVTYKKLPRQVIKLVRERRGQRGWMVTHLYKEVWQGTKEYRNMRIVRGG